MKRQSVIIMVLVLLTMTCFVSFATPSVEIDGKTIEFDVDPFIKNGRTLVPFRKIFEELGLKVQWLQYEKIAVAYNDSTYIAIKLDNNYGDINGTILPLDTQATIVEGRVLVPLRFVSEAFGNEVLWNSKTEKISIKSGFKVKLETDPLPAIESQEKLESILAYRSIFNNNYYINDMRGFPEIEFSGEDIMLGGISEPAMKSEIMEESAPEMSVAEDSVSETNVQVQGVDEADIVKTDGEYIYHVRQNDIVITKVDKGNIVLVSSILTESGYKASEIYFKDNKMIVVGNETTQNYSKYERMIWPQNNQGTKVIIYDMTNKAMPEKIRELTLEGNYLTSRLIGSHFYLVANKYFYGIQNDKNKVLPHYKDSILTDIQTISLKDIKYFPKSSSNNYMILAGLDLDNLEREGDIQTFLGAGSNVYVSKENMFVALSSHKFTEVDSYRYTPLDKITSVYKFSVNSGKINYKATGEVPGHILNQFSMDESNKNFRIATTTGDMWAGGENISKNNLYVLNSDMARVGSLEGIAPGERIYSVRFIGNRAYMVTFRQVDPFFVIDLSNSSAPTVLGYLKIPGYSDYLHPYDENTIIGFGKDTNETKSGVLVDGFKMAMFDVSNVYNPIEKHKVGIGKRGTQSEILNNHKALMFSKARNTLAFPITVQEENEFKGSRFEFQGAYVYTITPENGFELRGKSSHLTENDYKLSGDHWYQSNKNVERIIFIGDTIYTISKEGIKAHDFDTMSEINAYKY